MEVPKRLLDHFQKEWDRLKTYLYREHHGPYGSPLVIASKKTPPYIRIAGDFRWINAFVKRTQETMPDPLHVVQDVSKFPYLVDLDLYNGYHGMPLDEKTQNLLAVQAPDGLYAPMFLPEGVGPASGLFQAVMRDIFSDFSEWCFVIIDNIIIGAYDEDDLVRKLKLVLDKCRETGLVLKMTKSWIGVSRAQFFGYDVGEGTYRMDDRRVVAIKDIPVPESKKSMQEFLGATIFFRTHVPDFANVMAPLHTALKDEFDWSDDKLKADLILPFDRAKDACADAVTLHTPNYDLPWIIRPDASLHGVGGVLLQVEKDGTLSPIALCSHKFSEPASRWSTIEQEAFAIFYSIQSFRYLVYGKDFVVETDHANLQWMEQSKVAKIIRWRIALQDYDFKIRHIPGKEQIASMADYLSRLHVLGTDYVECFPPLIDPIASDFATLHKLDTDFFCRDCTLPILEQTMPSEYYEMTAAEFDIAFVSVHNKQIGHWGARRTHQLINKFYPGNRVPYREILKKVQDCPVCSKYRPMPGHHLADMRTHLEINPFPTRGWFGADFLTMPTSVNGNKKILAFVVHDTKLVRLYAIPDETKETLSACLVHFVNTNGRFKGIAADRGSPFTSNLLQLVNKRLRMDQKLAITDRHESNGVESTNQNILRYLRILCNEDRVPKEWDRIEYLSACENVLNNFCDSETGISAHELTYGTEAAPYFHLPEPITTAEDKHLYLRNLNNCLLQLREDSAIYHKRIVEERLRSNPAIRNYYNPGDLVLFRINPRSALHKFIPKLQGPYRVIQQFENSDSVQCRQIATGVVKMFHVTRLEIYPGPDDEQALQLAAQDREEHVVTRILGYRGNPLIRKYLTFLVEFADGSHVNLQYGPDLKENEIFDDYIHSKPELKILTRAADLAKEYCKVESTKDIVVTHRNFYLDLRTLDFTWYDALGLPNSDTHNYLIPAVIQDHCGRGKNKRKTRIKVFIPLLNDELIVDKFWIDSHAYRHNFEINTTDTLIDEDFLNNYPQVRQRVIEDYVQWHSQPEPALVGTPGQRQGKQYLSQFVRKFHNTDSEINDDNIEDEEE
jgi:hypothetical protein